MALAFTAKIELGYHAPAFNLMEPLTGKFRSLNEFTSEVATVVMFICNHCPYVKHVNQGLIKLANDYIGKGVEFVAINSNDATTYPEDAPERMIESAKALNYPFPYLYDATQQTARDYYASCTPDFSIFDKSLACVYRGQLDDSRPGNNLLVTGADIRAVLDAMLLRQPIPKSQIPSAGCSIKWNPN